MNARLQTLPLLRDGERMLADEFMVRYHAMPEVKKAELIGGVVHMPSPVSTESHADPHADLGTWLGMYRIDTPGVRASDNPTLRLGASDAHQPDNTLRIERGGRTRLVGGYMHGGPELAAEVASSSLPIDRGEKFLAYQRHRVLEHVLWRVEELAIDWFALRSVGYVPLAPGPDGILRSGVFPGLWLDPAALVAGDMRRVRAVLELGRATPEHAAFVAHLRDRSAAP